MVTAAANTVIAPDTAVGEGWATSEVADEEPVDEVVERSATADRAVHELGDESTVAVVEAGLLEERPEPEVGVGAVGLDLDEGRQRHRAARDRRRRHRSAHESPPRRSTGVPRSQSW